MSTNLFEKYYNNPTKSYIYTNLICNGESADEISFDITDTKGVISSNDESLSSIDLKGVHVPVQQYTNDMRTIEPHSFVYIRGMEGGSTYMSKSFGYIPSEISSIEDWMYKTVLFFIIKYPDATTGKKVIKSVKAAGYDSSLGKKTFVEACNDYFTDSSIFIDASYNEGFVKFDGTKLGYEVWIDHVLLWSASDDVDLISIINNWIVEHGKEYDYGWSDEYPVSSDSICTSKNVYSCIIKQKEYSRIYSLLACLDTDFNSILAEHDVKKTFLFEELSRYVAPKKYRNGAMKGIVLSTTYPVYNADDIQPYQKCIKMVDVVDRVDDYTLIPASIDEGTFVCVRKLMDVVDTYHSEYDSEIYDAWSNDYSHIDYTDNWIDSDEIPNSAAEMFRRWKDSSSNDSSMWINSNVSDVYSASSIYKDIEQREAMGLEGYCVYAAKRNLWKNVGQLYAKTTVADDENYPECRNLMNSIILYNPNEFPVTVNYMTFL